jgi:hypothetical protein
MIIVVAMMVGVSLKTVTRIDMKNWLKAIGIVILICAVSFGFQQAVYHHLLIVCILMGCAFIVGSIYLIKLGLDSK